MAKPFDLSGLELDELNAVIDEATKLREKKVAEKRAALMRQLEELDGLTGAKAPSTGTKGRGPKRKYWRDDKGREYVEKPSNVPEFFANLGYKSMSEVPEKYTIAFQDRDKD